MIFVTVGNWKGGFDRLIQAVDEQVEKQEISDEVVMQIGSGRYQPRHCQHIDYCSPEAFERYIQKCRIVISHAGMGTIAMAGKYGKPVIVVPRKAVLKEHFDDHQMNTAQQLEIEGKVLVAYETSEIKGKIFQAESFKPVSGQTSEKLLEIIEKYLEDLVSSSCT